MLQRPKAAGVGIALRILMAQKAMEENYTLLLHQHVFTQKPQIDQKSRIRSERILMGQEACSVLVLVWRDSEFVIGRDEGVDSVCPRIFFAGITCFDLAVHMSPTKKTVFATNARVQNIVSSSVLFGFLEKHPIHAKKNKLVATAFLNEFMVMLANLNQDSLEGVGLLRYYAGEPMVTE